MGQLDAVQAGLCSLHFTLGTGGPSSGTGSFVATSPPLYTHESDEITLLCVLARETA